MMNWVQTDSGKIYVEATSGGDAVGSGDRLRPGVENPWRSDGGRKPNLFRQQQIVKENPALARRLAQAAGVELPQSVQ